MSSRSQPLSMGIDLGGTKIHAVVLAPDGSTRWEHRIATPRDDYPATLSALAGLVQAADRATGGQGLTERQQHVAERSAPGP
jgi:fructokinase